MIQATRSGRSIMPKATVAGRLGMWFQKTYLCTEYIDNAGSSMQSMLRWCVFDVCTVGMARAGHSPSESNQADRKCLR